MQLKGCVELLFILINSFVLFLIMQLLGVPISNLVNLKQKYDTFSFSNDKTTSGINIIYNIFLPNIYILCLNEINYTKPYVNYLYLIVIGYLLIRYIVIFFILQRGTLLNFRYEFTLIFFVVFGTYMVFNKIIKVGISLMVPIKEFKNEIMLLLILFLYDIFKKGLVIIFENRDVSSKRIIYIRKEYSVLFNKYADYITNNIDDNLKKNKKNKKKYRKFLLLTYSIMIYENFSRPKIYRSIEFIASNYSSKKFSTGIMQVQSRNPYNDKDSIVEGIRILEGYFNEVDNYENEGKWVIEIADKYNQSKNNQYANEILYIFQELDSFTGIGIVTND